MIRVTYIATSVIVIFAIALGIYLILMSTDTAEDTYDIPSDITLINFRYKKPEWLTGHLKQGSIEAYIAKRKREITENAMDLRQEFPDSALLPFLLDITIDRIVLNEYESILITDNAYTGGAHSNRDYIYYNLHNGNNITLTDYLKKRGASETQLLTLINERLRRDAYRAIENFEDVLWQVHPGQNEQSIGIRILFPPYVVGPYRAGTITYTF